MHILFHKSLVLQVILICEHFFSLYQKGPRVNITMSDKNKWDGSEWMIIINPLASALFIILFFVMECRLVDWTLSLLTAYMMKERIELHNNRFMEHQPQIHLKFMIHLLYQATLLPRPLSKWQECNSKRIHLVLTLSSSLSLISSSSICWWTLQIPLPIQDLGVFMQIPFLTHIITIHLEAQACCKK